MRHYSMALNTELSKYRKRKRISLDGTIAGQTAGIYIGGLHHVRPPGSRSRGTSPVQHRSIYDARAFYEWQDQEYEQAAHWFEQRFPGTPFLRVEGSPRTIPPWLPEYEDCLMTPEFLDHATNALRQLGAEQAMLPSEPQGFMAEILHATNAEIAADVGATDTVHFYEEGIHEELTAPVGEHPWHDASHMDQEMFDQMMVQSVGPEIVPEPMAEQTDALGEMQDICEQQFQQGLEALVQEPMPEQDPFELQRWLYDQQMAQLMNPFMMLGPMGPFGPMPGM